MVGVNSSLLADFFSKYKPTLFQKNEIVIRLNEEVKHIYLVKLGRVKKSLISQKGEEFILSAFSESMLFPLSALFTHSKSHYYYETSIRSLLIKVPLSDMYVFLQSNPEVVFDLLDKQCEHTDALLKKTFYLMSGGAKARLMAQILLLAHEKGDHQLTLSFERTQKELAMSTGLTRETVSRELAILKQENLLKIRKKMITITNLKHWEEALEQSVS